MKGGNKGFRGEIKGTRNEENKVQIVLREKKNEGENQICKSRNKGLRGLTNGTRANEEKKKVKVDNKRCRWC